MLTPARLVTSSGVRWCQDTAQVLVLREPTGQVFQLTGLDAAVWGWFGLSYGYADVREFVRAFLDLPLDQAALRLDEILARWLDLGLLAPEEAVAETPTAVLQEARL